MIRFSPELKRMIVEAKTNGGYATRGHTVKVRPPEKSPGVTIDPWIQKAVDWYRLKMPQFQPSALDLQRRAAMLKAAAKTTTVVADTAQIVTRPQPTRDGGAVTRLETPTETVVAKTDATGAVEKVAVKEKNPLIPLALGAAALILLGG